MNTEYTKVDINFLIESLCKEINSIFTNLRGRL